MRTKKLFALALLLGLFFAWTDFSHEVLAQTRARTVTGKEVILYPDGTWKYATESTQQSLPKKSYSKPKFSKTLLKTHRGDFGVWYDQSKWKASRKPDEEQRWQFQLIGEDGYAMVIGEGIGMPTTSLKEIALQNAQGVAQDVAIVLEENRIVNSREILCLKIYGTIKQIPFAYYGYYYGGKEGSIQLITYTSQSLLRKYEQEFTNFLNGLVISP